MYSETFLFLFDFKSRECREKHYRLVNKFDVVFEVCRSCLNAKVCQCTDL